METIGQPWWNDLNRFSFGDGPAMADELADLVVQGIKTGTSWLVSEGEPTKVGQRHVLLDGAGAPVAVLETVELRQLPYHSVDAEFAFDSGEGDRTLESWREDYRNYYGRRGKFAEDMPMFCERFRVVEILGAPPSDKG